MLMSASFISRAQIAVEAIDDSYIYRAGDKAALVYGLDNEIITRTSVASETFTREAYCMFEIGTQAESFSNATLELYGNVIASKDVEIYYTDTVWAEETLTGNNRPLGTYITTQNVLAGLGSSSWDITNYVNQAKSSGANKISFVLKDIATDVSTADTKWHSKENPSGFGPKLILTAGDPPAVYHGSYFIDAINGNDQSSGQSELEAWKSLANIDALTLMAGDSLLFKSGCEWIGTFYPKGSGLPGRPVVIGKYGGEVKPIIKGSGLATNTISLSNQQYIELRDLAISNFAGVEGFRRAVYYQASDVGAINHVIFDNLEIYDVDGDMEDKDNGGIFIQILGSSIPTWFDTLVISNCHIHDVNRTGISNASYWDNRTLTDNGNWTPSKNVHIHHNTFERTGANALIVRVADKALMEYNLFDHCSILGTGNASFSFNTDSAIWQYNEARYTKFNVGDNDAGGFDSDYRAKYTIFQYNYSHDNGYGGILLTGGPGDGSGFNEGTIVRYNIFANNDQHIIRTSGNITNSKIYNNVFYTGPELSGVDQLWHKSWGGGVSDGTYYWNNIFYNEGTNSSFDFTTSTNNEFINNVFFGNPSAGQPYDPQAITSDPLLVNPGLTADGFDAVFQYMIKAGSPAIDKGIEIAGNNGTDLGGNTVPLGLATDIGAFEWYSDTVDVNIVVKDEASVRLEGATVWLEGYGNTTTNNKGVAKFLRVKSGKHIPLIINYTGYPTLGGSIDKVPGDSLVFILSKNAFDLKFIASTSEGSLLEGVIIGIPGIDTLTTNTVGEVVFSGLTESKNLFYKTYKAGYHSISGILDFQSNETISVTMDPRKVIFKVVNTENSPINDAEVSLENFEIQQTDDMGVASFVYVPENVKLGYSIFKKGFILSKDSISIIMDDEYLNVFLNENEVQFKVVDQSAIPLNLASVTFMDQLKYTNIDGLVNFTEVPLNEYLHYSVYQTGFETTHDSISLSASGETVYVIMDIPPGYKVNFSISDSLGNAISSAIVTLSGYGIMATNAAGMASFENVKPANNIIYAISKTGYKDTINVLNIVDADVDIAINMLSAYGTRIDISQANKLCLIYPNPATDFINIRISTKVEKLIIFDVQGRQFYSEQNPSASISLDIKEWDSGMYYVKCMMKNGMSETPTKFFILR